MLTIYAHFPKQIRALDAIKRLKTYFEIQGNTEKEPLPTMSKIVDYCIKHPRLLRIRDSPLKVLHDPNLPYVVVHDWYIGISLDYLEASVLVLLEQWEKDYKKKRHDPQQIAALFLQLVNDIYECYEHTGLALNLPFPEGSALAAAELKEKVKYASVALIREKITHTFTDARNIFYTTALKNTERLFRTVLKKSGPQKRLKFAYLFSSGVAKYEGEDLEYQVQSILDSDLPGLVDIFSLSDELLKASYDKSYCNDELNDIPLDSWLIVDQDEQNRPLEDLEKLEYNMQEFSSVCEKLNNLLLTPDWTAILKITIKERLNGLEWKDNWTVSMVHTQLKWLHVLILPWMSYVIPKSEDVDANWNIFLREKIKAEHVLYEIIYQSRIADIFDIIREYPTTVNAINDFHVVATKRGLLENLMDKLMQELQSRLLHQGASATDILQQYIACIQCLSIIDPSCGIMGPIIEMIENYMKAYRKDVVEGVVDLIRNGGEDGSYFLEDESEIYVFKQSELNNEEAPRDAVVVKEDKPAMLRRLHEKSRDPVAMLISMCDSLKDFIKGYSDKLGEVLLSTKEYDTDQEVRRLELLKRNFPSDTFIRCDIMLRDLDDSRRLDKMIHENRGIGKSFHAIILSRCYWPGGGDDDDDIDDEEEDDSNVQLWPKQKGVMNKYDNEFRRTKASRKLKFLPTMGSVELELEFKSNKKLKLHVRPEAALIIALFKSKDEALTKDDITAKVGISKTKVVECLEFWLKKNVLKLSADGHFSLTED